MSKRRFVAAAVAAAVAFAAHAALSNDEAEAEFQRGVAQYEAGKLDEAAAAFERAYSLDPMPVYLFSWAQSEVRRDRCAEAVELFRRYLATDPPQANREAAELRMGTCEQRLASEPAPPTPTGAPSPEAGPAPTATPGATPPSSALPASPAPAAPAATGASPQPATAPAAMTRPPAADSDEPVSWYQEPWTLVLLGTGVAATGAGAAVMAWGESFLSDAQNQAFATYDEHQSALDAGRTRRIAGGVTLGVGLALITGGVIRAIMVGDGVDDEEGGGDATPSAELWLLPGGVGAGARWRF